jgi:glycosyltransferase involved in cell wall biosynthesis
LVKTLEQMTRLSIPHGVLWEILVVNNNCTDSTDDVIRQFEKRLPLRRVFEARPGLSSARNRAVSEARGEWLVFTDDDVLVAEEWIQAMWGTVRRFPKAGVIGGPIRPWFAATPETAFLKAFPALRGGFCGIDHGSQERLLEPPEDVYGANMAFCLSKIRNMEFDVDLGPKEQSAVTGDEVHFIQRVRRRGHDVAWSPAMKVKHYVGPERLTLEYLKRYYVDHGRTRVRLEGMPEGKRLFGAPAWLWRQTAESRLRSALAHLTDTRETALIRLREHCYFKGMLRECRTLSTKLAH